MFIYSRGEWWPLWALLMTPFLVLLAPMLRRVREEINWRAAWATVLVFELTVFAAECNSVQRGHWIYNEARILGPRILGVPIEEPFLYYLFSPIFVIALMHLVRKMITKPDLPEQS